MGTIYRPIAIACRTIGPRGTPQLDGDDDWFQSVHTQDAALIAQLRAGEPWAMQDARQLLNLQKVVDACYESARIGREVVL